MMNFDAAIEFHEPEHFADCRMADLLDRMTVLDLGVHHTDFVLEEGRQIPARQIAVFIDRRCEDSPAMLAIPGGIVRSTPEERNAVWSSADDQSLSSLIRSYG
jgi:hypothetical protein